MNPEEVESALERAFERITIGLQHNGRERIREMIERRNNNGMTRGRNNNERLLTKDREILRLKKEIDQKSALIEELEEDRDSEITKKINNKLDSVIKKIYDIKNLLREWEERVGDEVAFYKKEEVALN